MVTRQINRLFFVVGLFLCVTAFNSFVFAIEQNAAYQLALRFAGARSEKLSKTIDNVRQVKSADGLRSMSELPFYIYNFDDNQGFVIISADNTTTRILGYADEGSFCLQDMPDNLKAVLNNYAERINQQQSNTSASTVSSELSAEQLSASAVIQPLLGTVKWNQSQPYNNLCPPDNQQRTLVGCVAVALGQIMKFHQYPLSGTGTHSYTHPTYGVLTANFGQTTYDWNSMLDSYSSAATDVQKTAVATLLYQLGVAVEMNYSPTNSTSTIDRASNALVSYFGFDPDIQIYDRVFLTSNEWFQLIKNELNQQRPLYYSGVTVNGEGHAFVCDGYDSQNFFHINWGWGGLANGYFDLGSLSYQYPGINGATGGFSMNQSILINMKKNDQISSPSYALRLNGYDFTTSTQTLANKNLNTFNSTFAAYNLGANSFTGKFGVGYRKTGGAITLLKAFGNGNGTTITVASNSNYPYLLDINAISLKDLAAGTYTILPVYKPSDSTAWSAFRGLPEKVCSLTATVLSSGAVTITPVKNTPVLSLTGSPVLASSLYNGKKTAIDFSVSNSGSDFQSYLGLALYAADKTFLTMLSQDYFYCSQGQTQSFHVTPAISVPAGSYYLAVVADSTNSGSYKSYKIIGTASDLLPVQILPQPGPSSLLLKQALRLANGNTVKRNEDVTLQADLTNTGGLFNNQLIAFIFPSGGGSSLTSFSPVTASIDSLENKTIEIKGQLTLADGDYLMGIYQLNAGSWASIASGTGSSSLHITVSGEANELNNNKHNSFFTLSDNLLHFNPDYTFEQIQLIDLYGKIRFSSDHGTDIDLTSLPAGIYLLRAGTNGTIFTKKIIRK